MKSCPTCKRTFEDNLTYCLIDGSILSPPFDPHATLHLPQQNPTLPMANPEPTTQPTAPMFSPARKSSRMPWIIGAGVTLLVAATIIVIALVNRNSNSVETPPNVAQQDKTKANEPDINNRNESPSVSVTENKSPAKTPTLLPSPQGQPDDAADSTKNQSGKDAGSESGDNLPEDLRDLRKYDGKYAVDMFKKEDGLKQRLSNLLGSSYQLFMKRWDVTAPIEKSGDILFAEGCMAHECTSEESLLAIDTSKGIISCAILSDSFGGKFRTFSEQNSGLPSVMKKKMQELLSMK
jgi:hypothetical protein